MRFAALMILMTLPVVAEARSAGRTLGYPRDRVWPTAVRYVAVDERAKIVDKDRDAGYVLFELDENGTRYHGSLEIVTVMVDEQPHVKFVIDLRNGPLWREVGMLKRLEQKLRKDLGSPPRPRPKDPKNDEAPRKDDKRDAPEDKREAVPGPRAGGIRGGGVAERL